MKRDLVLGIDGGTQSVRVGIYDLKGHEVGVGVTDYQTHHPHPGWAEQEATDWWNALAESVQKAMDHAGAEKEEIISIGLDTTCSSVVFSKKDGTPLRRSLLWMDIRSGEEAEIMAATGHDALKYNGFGNVSAEWMPSKVLWMKRNEPEVYENTELILDCADWLTLKMTGQITGSKSITTLRWYYDPELGGVPVDFYNSIGLDDVFEKLPEKILNLGERIGGLSKEAADYLGLLEGTPVGQGGVDATNGVIGLGVTKPGKLALITGSSHCNYALTDDPVNAKGIFGSFQDQLIPGFNIVEGGQVSTGSVMKWFKNEFCKDLEKEAEEKNIDLYDILNEEAKEIEPGSEGLVILEYWQGNRTPYVDPNVRGVISGLSLHHTRAHVYRAIMEAISYGADLNIRNFQENGIPVNEIFMAGGASKSELFTQIHADVTNLPINIPEIDQVSCLGSAIMATVTVGVYKDVHEAVANMVRYKKRVEPNPENHEIYKLYSEQYRKAYPLLKDWMHASSKIDALKAKTVEV
ncbi:FGGY-family carbohydrate kinase [Oceanobacillus kapialis]|uniref:Ribulokinase n=1 Tax=Oceanobacillus kapialis TaxID=481353 RepID=A0ABW5PZZ1_9BACI